MGGVRVLVGTRKGAFILTSDEGRRRWDVEGPLFGGWEVFHVAGSPADPDRLYASQYGGWFGQVVQRSDDGGATWEPVGNELTLEPPLGSHQAHDGTQRPWAFKRIWHFEPSLTDPDTVYAGAEDAALFRTTDGGATWHELPALRRHASGPSWQPGAGGLCLHTIVLDPSDPERLFVAISAAGVFRSDDGGESWQPKNRGLQSEGIPDPEAEVGHCVHRIAMHPSRPEVLFMQKHWDVMRSDDAGESRPLPRAARHPPAGSRHRRRRALPGRRCSRRRLALPGSRRCVKIFTRIEKTRRASQAMMAAADRGAIRGGLPASMAVVTCSTGRPCVGIRGRAPGERPSPVARQRRGCGCLLPPALRPFAREHGEVR